MSIGAVATLYDASCIASISSNLTAVVAETLYSIRSDALPMMSWKTDPTDDVSQMLEQVLAPYVTGHHFFVNDTTPRFDLDTPNGMCGTMSASKVASSEPPATAQEDSIPWLFLKALQGQDYGEVYRLETVGGSAPPSCEEAGSASFQVRYAAQYFFYA